MLQIDHVYEFFYQELFKDFCVQYLLNGVVDPNNDPILHVFTYHRWASKKIFFYDQEPILPSISIPYIEKFKYPSGIDLETLYKFHNSTFNVSFDEHLLNLKEPNRVYKEPHTLVISEHSEYVKELADKFNFKILYYFFHGFAALDWYRGHYSLNYNKSITFNTDKDFISYNRLISDDRSYRIYFVSQLVKYNLIANGLVSFGVTDNSDFKWQDETSDPNSKLSNYAKIEIENYLTNIDKLIIDQTHVRGSASADIPRTILGHWPNNDQPNVNALWHVVTETVFYYDKLHLTEKIFKPIVSKQPFMLLAAPGNLAYLRSYGFKTFDGIIDESYDTIQDNDQRVDAVVKQLHWYCNLSAKEKQAIIERLAPIVEHNFQHFYGAFKHIITKELLNNCKALFKEIGYDDSTIAYDKIYTVLTN